MKQLLSLALVAALLTLASLASHAASKPAPATETSPAPSPKAVFVIDPKFGRDPFFPKSDRISRLLPKITNEVPVVVTQQPQFPDEFRCQGIAGTALKRIAMVNGKSMEKGEKVDYRLSTGQTVKASCLEIKETSVILEINGIAKELHLRSDLK